jgi:hypothetical protein
MIARLLGVYPVRYVFPLCTTNSGQNLGHLLADPALRLALRRKRAFWERATAELMTHVIGRGGEEP